MIGLVAQRAIGVGSVVLGFDRSWDLARWVIELDSVVLGFDQV